MISINVIGELISGSYGNTPYSRTFEKDIYEQMVSLANQADAADSVEEYNKILSEFSLLCTDFVYFLTKMFPEIHAFYLRLEYTKLIIIITLF